MSEPTQYQRLIKNARPAATAPRRPQAEDELDTILEQIEQRKQESVAAIGASKPDPIEALRELTLRELIPTFMELTEKYAPKGFVLEMDASNFLQGGRKIVLEFSLDEYRSRLQGTVTHVGIAFQETRYSPMHGELLSGPLLRHKLLTADAFRTFVCERLKILLRSATRYR